MNISPPDDRARTIQLSRHALAALQLEKLNRLVAHLVAENKFYERKLADRGRPLTSFDQLSTLPHTTKEELQPLPGDEPFALNKTWPTERYVRCHHTSGTHGRPLVVLDTADDWQWWIEGWQYVLDAARITAADRALLAFSFGPFIGFWSAFDALAARGTLVIPGGGLGSRARLDAIRQSSATALLATPTYALRLAEVAAEHNFPLADSTIEKIIVAGEPGGSVPAIRERIESAWNAQVIDHGGATEIGPWGFADEKRRGLLVNEAEFIPEFVSIETGQAARDGELARLILTSLGRYGAPVLRYQTGDLVRPRWDHSANCRFVLLEGGILGRLDDMVIVRGMNIYPTAVEQILRSFPEVVEYRITARKHGALDELVVEVEDHMQSPARIADELHMKLGLKIDVRCVTAMSLPRFEGKGRRFNDERRTNPSLT